MKYCPPINHPKMFFFYPNMNIIFIFDKSKIIIYQEAHW